MATTDPIDLNRSERDVIALGLAHLSVERPGWYPACISPLAEKLGVKGFFEMARAHRMHPVGDDGEIELADVSRKPTEEELLTALEELVQLQRNYAPLLNGWDGGRRFAFQNAAQWIARLRATGTLPKT